MHRGKIEIFLSSPGAWPKALLGHSPLPSLCQGPGDESEAVARSFLLDREEMSKAFSDLKAPCRLKRKAPGELKRLGLAQECGVEP